MVLAAIDTVLQAAPSSTLDTIEMLLLCVCVPVMHHVWYWKSSVTDGLTVVT